MICICYHIDLFFCLISIKSNVCFQINQFINLIAITTNYKKILTMLVELNLF